MTFSDYAALAEIVAAIAVVVSLVYLAAQVRQSTRVSSATARHAISQFALQKQHRLPCFAGRGLATHGGTVTGYGWDLAGALQGSHVTGSV